MVVSRGGTVTENGLIQVVQQEVREALISEMEILERQVAMEAVATLQHGKNMTMMMFYKPIQ
ncbi:hypothetical protein DWX10_26645 [Clostridium sp. AF18-27]|nr:hypothetical protein DWX10_26645 [Clostridium sp. AF18-27]